MNVMTNENRDAAAGAPGSGLQPCPSCRTPMPEGLRFCRMCGFRLGEGVEEYTATRRFDSKPSAPTQTAAPTTNLSGGAAFNPLPGTWGAVAPIAPADAALKGQCDTLFQKLTSACNPARGGNWIITLVLVMTLLTAGILGVQKLTGTGRFAPPPPPVSYLEVDDFDTADGGGAMIEGLEFPNTSLERAGLRGGDIITGFDGKPIEDEDDIRRAVRETPVGKSVEVRFISSADGTTKTTTLTTTSRDEAEKALDALDKRPGGRGRIGLADSERVRVPDTNTYGVRIDDLQRNNAADLAGVKEGDIVLEFNGHAVSTPGDLRLRIYEAVPGTVADVVLLRGKERMTIPVKVGRS